MVTEKAKSITLLIRVYTVTKQIASLLGGNFRMAN